MATWLQYYKVNAKLLYIFMRYVQFLYKLIQYYTTEMKLFTKHLMFN